MKYRYTFILANLLYLCLCIPKSLEAQCLVSSLPVNTGYDPITNTVLSVGNQDPKWSVIGLSPDNQPFATGALPYQAWVIAPYEPGTSLDWAQSADSKWISFVDNTYYTTTATGNYIDTFSRQFRNCINDSVKININIAGDNQISNILVDGVSVSPGQPFSGGPGNFNVFTVFIKTIWLNAGTHTLNIIAVNYPQLDTENYHGINIYGSLSSATGINSLVSEANGCASYICQSIVNTCDSINLPDTIHACKNTIISFGAVLTGSASVLSTTWSPGIGLSDSTILNPQCSVGTTSVNYTLTVKALMGNGDTCTTSKSVYVAVSNLNPQITATHAYCTKQFNFTAIDSGGSNTLFTWGFGDAATAAGISVSHVYSSYGTYNVMLAETDSYGCKDSVFQSVVVAPNLNLVLNITNDTVICGGQNIQLNVSGADSSYIWTPASGLNDPYISDPIANIDSTIKYVVTGIDSGGICKGTDSVTIHLGVSPTVIVTGDSSICYGQYDQLSASGAVSYSWLPSDYITNSDIADPLVHPVGPATYVVTGTGSNGCTGKDSIFIDVRPLPVLSVSVSGIITCSDTAVQLSVSGANTYTWIPAAYIVGDDVHSQNPYVSPDGNTEFYVTGTDAEGCSNIDSVLVVSDKSASLFMPNAFTPNNDGRNDVIYPNVFCDLILDQFSIYNRWGQRVFTTSTEGAGWDGKFNGVPQPLGTFDYYVKGHQRSTGKSVFYKGNFTLVR